MIVTDLANYDADILYDQTINARTRKQILKHKVLMVSDR